MKFSEAFIRIGKGHCSKGEDQYLLGFIPEEIKNQTIVIDGQDFHNLRYSYGNPYTEKGIPFAMGSPQMPKIELLFFVMYNARVCFGEERFIAYCRYLFEKDKHQDALLEMRPICSSIPFKSIAYEVDGNKNKKIDWEIEYDDYVLRMDVKNRSGNTSRHLFSILQLGAVTTPRTNPEEFFRSTFIKFSDRENEGILQGAWISVGIKENREILDDYFDKEIPKEKMQFFIIAGWEDNDCYIKTRENIDKQKILSKFRLVESDKYVF